MNTLAERDAERRERIQLILHTPVRPGDIVTREMQIRAIEDEACLDHYALGPANEIITTPDGQQLKTVAGIQAILYPKDMRK